MKYTIASPIISTGIGYFFIYFPLHASARLGFLPEIYQTRFNIGSSAGTRLKIDHLFNLWNLTGVHILLLMIVGLFSLLKSRRREGLFVAGWFIFLLLFLSSISQMNQGIFFKQFFLIYFFLEREQIL